MSRLGLSKLCIMGSIALSLAWVEGANGQSSQVPDLSGGDGGWVHARGAGFRTVPGSAPMVSQDPGHPFTPGRGTAYRIGDTSNPNLKQWAKDVMKKDADEIDHGKVGFQPSSSCVPAGVPNMMESPGPLMIVQGAKEVVMFGEGGNEVRHIHLDVPHSANPKPSWTGESVGHYEGGDTLVVDTIGLSDRTFVDGYRTPHTTQEHVVERFKITDGGKKLDVSFTVDDPGAFYKPWGATRPRFLAKGQPLTEDACANNNDDKFNQGFEDVPTADKPDF